VPRRSAEIALVHYTAPPVVGGVERVMARHAALMADAGHRVRIVAGRGAASDARVRFERVELADSLHPEILEVGAELASGIITAEFGALARRLEEEMGRALQGADVAILHNVVSLNRNLPLTAALFALAARSGAPRLILWHHDLAWTMPRYRLALHDGEPWSLLRTAWPGAIQVTISESRRRDLAALMGLDPSSIEVVPGGVDLPADAGPAPARPIPHFEPALLASTRVTPRKNIELAVEAVAALRTIGRQAGLIVTGPVDPHDPTERRYLDRLKDLRRRLELDEAVVFLAETEGGPPSDDEMDWLYRAAAVLILPSWDEGFGLPVLEAAVRGLPVVCADLPSLRELAGDDATYLPPGASGRAAARAVMEAIARGPSERLAERVRTTHSWPAVYRRDITPLLERALSG
jgi:glycosyltransferase involved in cell wall biosynthesis